MTTFDKKKSICNCIYAVSGCDIANIGPDAQLGVYLSYLHISIFFHYRQFLPLASYSIIARAIYAIIDSTVAL